MHSWVCKFNSGCYRASELTAPNWVLLYDKGMCDSVSTHLHARRLTSRSCCNLAMSTTLQVRRPTPGRLLVKPFCRMWSSVYYCNLHQPDFLTGSSDNTCGAATINSSHIAAYEQCAGGGFNCQKFQGEQRGYGRGGRGEGRLHVGTQAGMSLAIPVSDARAQIPPGLVAVVWSSSWLQASAVRWRGLPR